jgi:hypothetical protein
VFSARLSIRQRGHEGRADQLTSPSHARAAVQAVYNVLDGRGREAGPCGNLLIGKAVINSFENLRFLRTKGFAATQLLGCRRSGFGLRCVLRENVNALYVWVAGPRDILPAPDADFAEE